MKNLTKKLIFNLLEDTPSRVYSVGVMLDGQEIYRIKDFFHFSKSLGLLDTTDTSNQTQHFVDNGENVFPSTECFQSKVIEYLFENCAQFRKSYQLYFTSLAGNCEHKDLLNNTNCKQCYRHPSTTLAQAFPLQYSA